MLLHDVLKNIKIGELLTCHEKCEEYNGLYIVYYLNPVSKILTQAYKGDIDKCHSDYIKKQLLYNHSAAVFNASHVLRDDWVIVNAEDSITILLEEK